MSRRKGELTAAQIDREYPHQVALTTAPDDSGATRDRWHEIEDFCRGLSKAERGHSVYWGNRWWNVHCFADPKHAARFRERFDGVPFDPKDRGRGHAWAKWNRKT